VFSSVSLICLASRTRPRPGLGVPIRRRRAAAPPERDSAPVSADRRL